MTVAGDVAGKKGKAVALDDGNGAGFVRAEGRGGGGVGGAGAELDVQAVDRSGDGLVECGGQFVGSAARFGAVFFLTQGGPANPNYQFAGDTDILISWIYKLTLDNQMYSMAAVMSILIFLVVGSVAFWNFRRTSAFKDV